MSSISLQGQKEDAAALENLDQAEAPTSGICVRYRFHSSIIVLSLFGLLLAIGGFFLALNMEKEVALTRFHFEAKQMTQQLNLQLAICIADLNSFIGLLTVYPSVDLSAFLEFHNAVRSGYSALVVMGVGYAPIIKGETARVTWEQQTGMNVTRRTEKGSFLREVDGTEDTLYMPLTLVTIPSFLGWNFLSTSNSQADWARNAITTGDYIVSHPQAIPTINSMGVSIFKACYRNVTTGAISFVKPSTEELRMDMISGVMIAMIPVASLIDRVQQQFPSYSMSMELWDSDAPANNSFLGRAPTTFPVDTSYNYQTTLQFGEHKWTLLFAPKKDTVHVSSTPLLVAFGILCCFFLTVTAYGAVVSRKKVLKTARVLSESVKTKKAIIQMLQQARQDAETANQTKSNFTAYLCHELRNPLHAMMALLEESTNDPKVLQEEMATVKSCASTMSVLLNDVLDMSKIEAGKMIFQNTSFHLSQLVQTVCRTSRALLGSRPVSIQYEIDESVPMIINGDPTRIRQVISNLMTNAIKYTEQGTIKLHVSLRPNSTRATDSGALPVLFSVQDTGLGMSDLQMKSLFDPYESTKASTLPEQHGIGLGLTIVRNLVEIMGGEMSVSSTLGVGSTFTVELILRADPSTFSLSPNLKESFPLSSSATYRIVGNTRPTPEPVVDRDLSGVVIEMTTASGSPARAPPDPTPPLPSEGKLPTSNSSLKRNISAPSLPSIVSTPSALSSSSGSIRPVSSHTEQMVIHPPTEKVLTTNLTTHETKLEVRGAPAEREQRAPREIPKPIQDYRILVVDDSAVNRRILVRMLESEGFPTEVAHNGLEAIVAVEKANSQFSLIFMDVVMPLCDGIEATRILRQKGITVPVISLTANAMLADQTKCTESGMNYCLSKPFNKQDILDVVARFSEPSLQQLMMRAKNVMAR
jgi:signal transduction histidine kinase/ActR/RegA family two-component response regulator